MKTPRILFLLLSVACNVSASQEGLLALSSFRLESAGIGSSGKVVVEGKQNDQSRMVSLKITAFGRDFLLPEDKLAGLSGLASNGIRLSYEDGYPELGGRTLYIQFQVGFTSGTREQALVTLTENGKVEVKTIKAGASHPDRTTSRSQPTRSGTNATSPTAGSEKKKPPITKTERAEIEAVIKKQTDEKIIKIERESKDTLEVTTGVITPGRLEGKGQTFLLKRTKTGWEILRKGLWVS